MKILRKFLEWLRLRCSKCGSYEITDQVVTELRWGTNIGDVLLMDPYYAKYRQRICCECGHTVSSVFSGTESAEGHDVHADQSK